MWVHGVGQRRALEKCSEEKGPTLPSRGQAVSAQLLQQWPTQLDVVAGQEDGWD